MSVTPKSGHDPTAAAPPAAAAPAASPTEPAGVDERELRRLAPVEREAAAAFLAAHPPGLGTPLAVVIPAYNEEPTVAGVVGEIPAQSAGLDSEVIVVVDGARDATAERARAAGALVCDLPVNRGQGAALRLGYWLARARGAQIIATIDADGQYEPHEIARVIEPILAGRADFVSGSRRLGAELTTDKVRHLGVLVFGALISVLVRHRITDPACGIRAMRAGVSAAVTLEQQQYQASELMISAALNGYRLAEVPTTMRDRGVHATLTKKGSNFGYGVRFARAAIHTWRRDRKAARTRLRPEKIQCS
jgi:glycosyltransferase involved in cell wall biosynthesis